MNVKKSKKKAAKKPAKKPARKTATKTAKKTATKAKGMSPAAKYKDRPPLKPNKDGIVLLSGGNPQIAMGDGDAPVQKYIAAMPEWKSAIGRRIDTLIMKNVSNVQKCVKWNSPFYGVEGNGWFLSFHVFTKYVQVTFFQGTSLQPVPPDSSKHPGVRYLKVHEHDLDEAQLTSWIKQAAAMPGIVPWSTK